jgi:hypothetical protein
MGGGGKGGGGVNEAQAKEAYTNFGNYAQQSRSSNINDWGGYSGWASANPSLAPYAQAGWDAAMQQRRMQEMMQGFTERMGEMFAAPEMPAGPTPEELEQQRLEREREEGTASRDTLYGDYLDAANTATDYIDRLIEKERSNAQLLGIDYNVTPEQRSQRINDYFASIWDESKDTELKSLFEKWGNPEGFTDWTVTRGEAATQDAENKEQATPVTPGGLKPTAGAPTTAAPGLLDEEDQPLGATSILGGA